MLKQPGGVGPNGRALCRGRCGNEVAIGRSAWCSDACQADSNVRAGWHVRFHVAARDRGVCALCKSDADKTRRVMHRLSRRSWRDENSESMLYDESRSLAVQEIASAWMIRSYRWGPSGALWEADHIVPVAEGGGGCGIAGYRTLCRPCHLSETRKLRARLSEKKRNERNSKS